MADPAREFICNSNDAVVITLKQPADETKNVEFKPEFTYSVFGNEEIIVGYKNLQIDLSFAADTLQAGVAIAHTDQIQSVGDTKADVIEERLKDYLPTISFGDDKNGEKPAPLQHPDPFVPPGKVVHSYDVNGRKFGVWEVNLTDPRAKQILRQMQIFVHFFIEGGTFIELDDPDWTIERWTIYFLYAHDRHPHDPSRTIYTFAGYSTAYRLFHLDLSRQSSYLLTPPSSQHSDSEPSPIAKLPEPLIQLQSQLPSRYRVSQFIILPPYQKTSHGSHLYSAMLARAIADPTILELTVEDPNERFDDLRDTNDLLHLRATIPAFNKLRVNPDVSVPSDRTARAHAPLPKSDLLDQELVNCIKRSSRLCDRQLGRLVEMQTLHNIPVSHRNSKRITRKEKASDKNDRAYYWWRMLVKQRLTKHNSDALQQMQIEERVEKLEETLESVVVGYQKCLERCDRRVAVVVSSKQAVNGADRKGKRKSMEDGDDDVVMVTNGSARKRARVVDDEDDE
ncbi:MAG: hypothetical protein Q9162_004809 [Coniocarpon cinnabarinum]